MSGKAKPPAERFERHYIPEPNSGCWLWVGVMRNGYGAFRMSTNPADALEGAHRASWTLHKGAIPDGKIICHACDTPLCVNPDHLFVGTYTDNMQDAARKGRMKWKEKKRPGLLRGEHHPSAKLCEKDIIEIRASEEQGIELAAKYNVSANVISQIRKRKIWAHVGGQACHY